MVIPVGKIDKEVSVETLRAIQKILVTNGDLTISIDGFPAFMWLDAFCSFMVKIEYLLQKELVLIRAMGRLYMANKKPLPVKIAPELKERIDAVKVASKPQITGTAIVEYCLTLGLPVLEGKYGVRREE